MLKRIVIANTDFERQNITCTCTCCWAASLIYRWWSLAQLRSLLFRIRSRDR